MTCPNCGAPVTDPDFCNSCGTPLRENKNNNYGDSYNNARHAQRNERQSYQQPVYQQPVPVYVDSSASRLGLHPDEHVSTWGWIGRWVLMCIPILNIILLLVWGFGGSSKRSLVTWARAQLVLTLISIIIAVIAIIIMTANGINVIDAVKRAFQGY